MDTLAITIPLTPTDGSADMQEFEKNLAASVEAHKPLKAAEDDGWTVTGSDFTPSGMLYTLTKGHAPSTNVLR